MTASFLGAPLAGGHCPPSSPHSMTDSDPQICTESCLDNCQLSLCLTAIKDEGSFFLISLWLCSSHLPSKCRGMVSWPPTHQLIIDGSFLSDGQSGVCTVSPSCRIEFLLNDVQKLQNRVITRGYTGMWEDSLILNMFDASVYFFFFFVVLKILPSAATYKQIWNHTA